MRERCTACGSEDLEEVLSLGSQPLSTRLEASLALSKSAHTSPLGLGCCLNCKTVQLVSRFPLSFLQNKFPSILFREPEQHLPETLAKIKKLFKNNKQAKFLGLTYIDNEILNMLSIEGYHNTIAADYGFAVKGRGEICGLETVQSIIRNTDVIEKFTEKIGLVDLVSARFILEHAESAIEFLTSVSRLVKPNGYIVIEVPDYKKMLSSCNHALIWEDHFTYFCLETLCNLVSRMGAVLIDISQYAYDYEDVLVAIVKVNTSSAEVFHSQKIILLSDVEQGLIRFSESFAIKKHRLRTELDSMIGSGEKLALFGAGHHAAKFVNFYQLEDLFEFVIDDNPNKVGLFLPGTGLQIYPSQHLIASGTTVCVSTVSPSVEQTIREKMPWFFVRGGRFIPAFDIKG